MRAVPTLMAWSSGKDCAWALHRLRQDPRHEVVGLFCTVNSAFERVAMHGVRVALLRAQAQRVGLPLEIIELPFPCSNADYERIMGGFVEKAREQGVGAFGFGDLFLEDVRAYRERQLQDSGIEPVFPLWGEPTDVLAREMIAAGLRAVITCVDPRQAPAALAGRSFDTALLEALPEGVDPCGERGEFHSFAWDGPMFGAPVAVEPGKVVERDGFVYADLLPATGT